MIIDIKDNSAARFHRLLELGHAAEQSLTCQIVLTKILDTPKGDTSLLYEGMAELFKMPEIVKRDITAIYGIDHDLMLEWYKDAQKAVDEFNPRQHWKSFIGHFPPKNMYSLRVCADALSKQPHGLAFDETNISRKEFLNNIDELLENLDNLLDVSSSDWKFINYHLNLIRDALRKYEIFGPEKTDRALKETLGAINLNQHKEELMGSEAGKKFWSFLANLAASITVVSVVAPQPIAYEQPHFIAYSNIQSRMEFLTSDDAPKLLLDSTTKALPKP